MLFKAVVNGALLLLWGGFLTGCSSAPAITNKSADAAGQQEYIARYRAQAAAEFEERMNRWDVTCTDDNDGTAERYCSARNSPSLTVSFIDGRGPYVQIGFKSSFERPNVVRVDDGPIRATNKGNSLLPGSAIVEDMLKGKVAYVTSYDWPYTTPITGQVKLDKFKAAYEELLRLKASPSARSKTANRG